MTKCARSGFEHGGEKLLRSIKRQREAEKIGAAGVGIFFVARRIAGRKLGEQIPRGISGEELFLGRIAAGKFVDAALRATATFEQDHGDLTRIEGTRRVVVRKWREKRNDFGRVGRERFPGVAIAVVDDRAGVQGLLDAGGVFADYTHNHVDEFVEAEGLFDYRAHADVNGVFVGVAQRDLVGKGHSI